MKVEQMKNHLKNKILISEFETQGSWKAIKQTTLLAFFSFYYF